jgi:flagellin
LATWCSLISVVRAPMKKRKILMSNSVNTNRTAMLALQSLNQTNTELAGVQKRVSTGYRVADARDDGGAYAVAQAVRSDVAGVIAVNEQLGGVKGILQTTFATLSQVSDTMRQARAALTRLADGAISSDQRKQYEEQYKQLSTQITQFINDGRYNGRTLLSTDTSAAVGGGDLLGIRNEDGGTFMISATNGTALQLGTAIPTDYASAATFLTSTFSSIENTIATALNKFGANMQYIENQMAYNSKKVDALNDGLGALVDADLAKESANLQALQTRQQLGVQTLSLANQGSQTLLSLFR